jgi:pimeloyl-ACP methyl ester carboxylesterase
MISCPPAKALDDALGEPEHARVRGGTLAFWRRGLGGVPLLLVHGWPATRRLWARNVADLAARGFDVIAPDLRGFGDSDCGADGLHDVVAHSLDMAALLTDCLGLREVVAVGGDLGAAVIQDLSLRCAGLVERLVVFNGPLPTVPAIKREGPRQWRNETSHSFRPATEPDTLIAELATPQERLEYVAKHYRTWSPAGAFSDDDLAYLVEPFADALKLRASFGTYESLADPAKRTGPSMIRANDTPTLILEALSDPRQQNTFGARAALVFARHVGPFGFLGAGHFLQWEAADRVDDAISMFCSDRLGTQQWRDRLSQPAPTTR